jgi:hypothetical protein
MGLFGKPKKKIEKEKDSSTYRINRAGVREKKKSYWLPVDREEEFKAKCKELGLSESEVGTTLVIGLLDGKVK